MLEDEEPRSSLRLDEDQMEILSEVVAKISRVLISSSIGLGVGATIGGITDIVLNGTVGPLLATVGIVIGAIVGGVAGALSLVVDAYKRRNKPQDGEDCVIN